MYSASKDGGFGGKGESGMGRYRGKPSFDAFTHRKTVCLNAPNFDPLSKYPPFDVSTTGSYRYGHPRHSYLTDSESGDQTRGVIPNDKKAIAS